MTTEMSFKQLILSVIIRIFSRMVLAGTLRSESIKLLFKKE